MFKDICINNKSCELMKSVNKPKYGSRTILTDSCWEYVALFLKRKSISGASDALFYWEQAHSFYLASQELPDNARPLTSYYCILSLCEDHFYNLLQPEDVEDLLSLWLYDTKKYVCIPSTNKIATPKYECVLIDPNDLNRKHVYIQVKKGKVDLNADDYADLNGEVYLLTTEGHVSNVDKYSNVFCVNPSEIYQFAINADKAHMIPENVLYWVRFLTEIENTKINFSGCKGIMFDTNLSYSDTNEVEMLTDNKISAYGNAARYIDSFQKGDYALFYSKRRGIIAVGKIVSDNPIEIGDEKHHKVEMIVPENFDGNASGLPSLTPNEIKAILNRNFYWASTIKTPFLTGLQVEMLIRELKKKYI